MSDGHLIAFEGIDGAGKSTQARQLAAALRERGHTVRLTREPTDGPAGQRLRASARSGRLPAGEELELFLQDRREHVQQELVPAVERGEIVLIDRYYPSTVAYQGARGLDPQELLALNEAFAPLPSRVVLLDLEPRGGVTRVRGRDTVEDAFEREEDLRRAREIFLWLASQRPFFRVFDASLPEEALRDQILHDILQVIR
jgi:dTMP kinase